MSAEDYRILINRLDMHIREFTDFFDILYPENEKEKAESRNYLIHLLKNNEEDDHKYFWNLFEKACKKCVQNEAYLPVCRFMAFILTNGDLFDAGEFKVILDKIQVRKNYKLSDLCAEYFYVLISSNEVEKIKLPIKNADELYDYVGNTAAHLSMSVISSDSVCSLLCERLYDVRFDVSHGARHSHKEIDYLIDQIRKSTFKQEEYRVRNGIKLLNALISPITYLEHNNNRWIEGIEGEDNLILCHYIYNRYVFGTLAAFSKEDYTNISKNETTAQCMKKLFDLYKYLIWGHNDGRMLGKKVSWLKDDAAVWEFVGKKDDMIIAPATKLLKDTGDSAYAIYQIFETDAPLFEDILSGEHYQWLISLEPLMLYVNGYVDEMRTFLARHYQEMELGNRRLAYMYILLSRGILESKELSVANTLYGYLNHEMSPEEIYVTKSRAHVTEIRDYLIEVKQYIFNNRLHDNLDNEAIPKLDYYKIVFEENTNVDDVIDVITRCLEAPVFGFTPADLNDTYKVVEAVSYDQGIHLGMLNVDRIEYERKYGYFAYDKLEEAIPNELIKRGKALLLSEKLYLSYLDRIKCGAIWKEVDLYLYDHIQRLIEGTLEDKIKTIEHIKNNANIEDVDKELDRINEYICQVLYPLSQKRNDLEAGIRKLYDEYASAHENACKYKTLTEALGSYGNIKNYLLTSEIVYEYLVRMDADSEREGSGKKMDYSAAMIPLTKALEVVANLIFARIAPEELPWREADKALYNKKTRDNNLVKRLDSVTLGSFSNVFRVYKERIRAGSLVFETRTDHCWFKEWNGENVLDISQLRELSDINISVEAKDESETKRMKIVNFDKVNDDLNLQILYMALLYVASNYRNAAAHKDHVNKEGYLKCKELMLQSEYLLWILLNMIKQP